MLVIRDGGMVMGSVSGACVEDDMIDRVRAAKIAAGRPELVVYGVTKEQAERFGLPCGGTLEIFVEPVTGASQLAELLERVSRHELVARRLDMGTGAVTPAPGKWSDALEFDGKSLLSVHGPRWRLLIIGAGQLSRYLAQMAQALPSPPSFETAEANFQPETQTIPAWIMGYSISNRSVILVVNFIICDFSQNST